MWRGNLYDARKADCCYSIIKVQSIGFFEKSLLGIWKSKCVPFTLPVKVLLLFNLLFKHAPHFLIKHNSIIRAFGFDIYNLFSEQKVLGKQETRSKSGHAFYSPVYYCILYMKALYLMCSGTTHVLLTVSVYPWSDLC